MEEIIKKAIEGGYKMPYYEQDGDKFSHLDFLLDPLFWQALGKACGWKFLKLINEPLIIDGEKQYEWKINALRFHEINLTEGWSSAVEYLTNLINQKS